MYKILSCTCSEKTCERKACLTPCYESKYAEGLQQFGEWGIYTTSEKLVCRHHTTAWIMELLSSFNIQWFEQIEFKTMNQNPVRSFHCVAQKTSN